MVDNQIKLRTQKVFATGKSSLVVVVPQTVVLANGMKSGDTVDVLWDGKQTLTYKIKVNKEELKKIEDG